MVTGLEAGIIGIIAAVVIGVGVIILVWVSLKPEPNYKKEWQDFCKEHQEMIDEGQRYQERRRKWRRTTTEYRTPVYISERLGD